MHYLLSVYHHHHHHHHHHHISVMQLGHLLTRFGLTYPEVSSKVYHDSFCQSDSSISLPWVIYFDAFYLHVVSSFSCIPVICPKLVYFQWISIFNLYILIIKPTRCTNFSNLFLEKKNSTCFGQFLCPSSGVFHCTHSNGICHTGLLTAWQQTCMTYTIAVCTVKNSWWWTEELSETCIVLFQK